jgi:hypothetical protein
MAASQWILQFMGMEPGGRNEENFGHGRQGSYEVYNNTRKVGKGRAPGTAAATSAAQAVGEVPFVYPRMHDSVFLAAEKVHNLARIGDEAARDIAGQEMIRRQTQTLGQKAGNFRAAMVAGMFRDSLYVHQTGDDWYFNYTSASSLFRINFQRPAGNLSQLDMLGDGDIIDVSWDNPSANIPKHVGDINAAFEELYGGRLENILVTSNVWNEVLNNDKVGAQAGIANSPFRTLSRVAGTRADGSDINVETAVLASKPTITWWITDEGLELGDEGSETFTKYVGDNNAVFMGSPDSGAYSISVGSEPIAEVEGMPQTVKAGLASWSATTANPTGTNLFVLDNSFVVDHIPNATAYGTVIF